MPAFAILTDALDAARRHRARHPLRRRREQRAPRCLRGTARPRARPAALPAGGRRRAGDADDHPGRRAGAVRRHVLGVRARPDRRGAARAGQRGRAQGEVLPRARPPAGADARHRAQGVRPPARLRGGERARGPRSRSSSGTRCSWTRSRTSTAPGIEHRAAPDDIAFIQFSSGSTSEPKGVVLTHRNLTTNIDAIGAGIGARADDASLSWMPLTHDMGLIGFHLTPLFAGRRPLADADGAVRAPTGAVARQGERAPRERHLLAELRLPALSQVARSGQGGESRPVAHPHHLQRRRADRRRPVPRIPGRARAGPPRAERDVSRSTDSPRPASRSPFRPSARRSPSSTFARGALGPGDVVRTVGPGGRGRRRIRARRHAGQGLRAAHRRRAGRAPRRRAPSAAS